MKKIFALISIVIVMVAFPSVAFANPTLTIEEATRRAINNSNAIRNSQDNVTLTRENEQRMRDVFWQLPTWTGSDFIRFQADIMRIEAGRAVTLNSITAQRETLGFIVANHFANIVMAQNELVLFDENLVIMRQDIEMLQTMETLGMASGTQLRIAQNGYQQALHNRANLIASIETAFRELNRLMGTNQNNIYDLVFEQNFEPLQDIDIERYIRLHQNSDIQVDNAVRQLSIARFELNSHGGEPFNRITGTGEPGAITRTERELAVTQGNRDLEAARESVENNVIDLHNNILSLELAIQGTELQISILAQELLVMEVQYYVGHLIKIELDRTVLEMYNLQETLRRHKVNHGLLVMQLTNPSIALG
ncbi:MAG: TolC family protein [Defluviitaleaceae bacterium]|nr:TolC family protein [Defluviitaleaceae bacterium]